MTGDYYGLYDQPHPDDFEDELRAEADEEMARFDGPPAVDIGLGAAWDLDQSTTACCPRETIPDSCSCPDGCECWCADCGCGEDDDTAYSSPQGEQAEWDLR